MDGRSLRSRCLRRASDQVGRSHPHPTSGAARPHRGPPVDTQM